jgi:hypothetical protein
VLNTRLQRLVEAGLLERRLYNERPERYEYRLTRMGVDLWPAVHALMRWGDRYLTGDGGPPMRAEHRGCGGDVTDRRTCAVCGAELEAADVQLRRAGEQPGPELVPAPR